MPPDEAEYTRGERVAGLIGLAVLAALALIMIDLASGGRLARLADPGGDGDADAAE